MPKDPRIDAYIARAQPFAKPVLEHLRALVHNAVPEAHETIKWGMPAFLHHGSILCGMASFKAHCAFWFWKGSRIPDTHKIFGRRDKAMGQLGRIGSLKDLPRASVLTKYLKAGAALNEKGIGSARKPKPATKALRTPADLSRSLARIARTKAIWDRFPPSQRNEYVEWISEAKTPGTRAKRLATSLAWIGQGKYRNWRYMRSKKS